MRADAGGAEPIRIATGFTSVDQLVTRAGLLVDADSVFVATATPPPANERRRFELVLADGKVALAGVGEVIGGAARVGLQTGVRLRIVELDEASRPVHARIVAAKPATLKSSSGGPRLAPPPFRKPGEAAPEPGSVAAVAAAIAASAPGAAELQPAAVAELAAAVAEPVPEPAPVATPEPVVAAPIEVAPSKPPAEPTELIDDYLRPAGMRQLPPWMRSKRVQIVAAVIGGIFLVGIIAAFASEDPPAPRSTKTQSMASSLRTGDRARDPGQPTTAAAPTPTEPAVADEEEAAGADVDAGVEADPEEVAVDEGGDDTGDDDAAAPAPAPAKKKRAERSSRRKRESPAKRTARRDPPEKKKDDRKKTGRQVRLTVRSEPAGASIKVNGASISGGVANVEAGSTVKVTATKRGYKRATRSVKVGKGTSVVIKLEKM